MHGERFEKQKAELEKIELDRRRREKLVSEKKDKLAKDLNWVLQPGVFQCSGRGITPIEPGRFRENSGVRAVLLILNRLRRQSFK